MNTPAVTETGEKALEIPSLLIPMADGKLILPTVSVAEMITYQRPQLDIDNAPAWYMGKLLWRGIQVPMISYEALNGGNVANIREESQVLVLNNTGVNTQLPFICMSTQGIPRLSRVAANEISHNTQAELPEYGQLTVNVAGEEAVIPDVAKIEQVCANLLGYY